MFNTFKSLLRRLKPKSLEEQLVDFRVTKTIHTGANLTEDKAESLETMLQSDPLNIEARASLIGYLIRILCHQPLNTS